MLVVGIEVDIVLLRLVQHVLIAILSVVVLGNLRGATSLVIAATFLDIAMVLVDVHVVLRFDPSLAALGIRLALLLSQLLGLAAENLLKLVQLLLLNTQKGNTNGSVN